MKEKENCNQARQDSATYHKNPSINSSRCHEILQYNVYKKLSEYSSTGPKQRGRVTWSSALNSPYENILQGNKNK